MTTYAISRARSKEADAAKIGADGFLATSEKDWNKDHEMIFDFILCTASSDKRFDLAPFVSVGFPEGAGWYVRPQSLISNGCLIGGSREEDADDARDGCSSRNLSS